MIVIGEWAFPSFVSTLKLFFIVVFSSTGVREQLDGAWLSACSKPQLAAGIAAKGSKLD